MAEGPSQYVAADMDKEDEKHSSNVLSENFVEYGKHYSHEHPLKLISRCEDDDIKEGDDDDEAYKSLCRICGVPILSSPSYTCSIGCKFIIHQPCALKLPTSLIHPTHGPLPDDPRPLRPHTLYLEIRSTSFIYECGKCEFSLHPLVAFPHVEIKVKHKSHASHSLVAFCKRISCECDACGREEQGFFFHCGVCNFWIHQDCTILPSAIQFSGDRYPYILAYSLPSYLVSGCCMICMKNLLVRSNGVYFSPDSTAFAHIVCVLTHKLASKAKLDSIQLPDDEWDTATFPILVIRKTFAHKKRSIDGDVEFIINRYHNCDDDDDDNSTNRELSRNLYCDLCTRATNISSSSHYKYDNCDFVAHKLCADILPVLKDVFIQVGTATCRGKLCLDLSAKFFNSIFYCIICRRPCNGFCHYFDDFDDTGLFIDLECMAAPSTINHASHPQHLLIRTHQLSGATLTCCPDKTFFYDVYRCIFCNYSIHVSCAMLPKRIICHDYDEHPLHLAFTSTANLSCSNFCEVCEEEIDLHYWLYRCQECDKLFHINCIPSVGYLSKVKFGGTLSLPHSHTHPLALTRMLTAPSQRCAHCNQIIQGMQDQMAFFCSHCHFWLHFSCARDANATKCPSLRLFSENDYVGLAHKFMEFFTWSQIRSWANRF